MSDEQQGADDNRCAAIVLAAGAGKRFGDNKILNAKIDNKPLGLVTAERYRALMPTIVVVRAGESAVFSMFERSGFSPVVSERAKDGMGYSLAAGIKEAKLKQYVSYLVVLGDMPLVQVSTILTLQRALIAGTPIVRPTFRGQAGNPVGFQQTFSLALSNIAADKGAQDVVKAHASQVETVEVEDEGVIMDIDTPAMLADAQARV
ncbi:MAG: nucleotidyltransferase family protein [Pseudomonadota bacterium]